MIGAVGLHGDVGLVSIDVDGVDYWLLHALTVVSPRILVVEYNSLFGPNARVTVPYSPDFDRTAAHFSNLFFGASHAALTDLASEKGSRSWVRTAGTNGFFVRRDVLGPMHELAAADAWRETRVRQSRDPTGALTYVTGLRKPADADPRLRGPRPRHL